MIIMQEQTENFTFFGISGKGEAHLKAGKPNQDAIGFNALDDSFVIALSDGLGSCSNAQIGAQTAVLLCNNIFIEIANGQLSFESNSIIKRLSDLWNESFPKIVAKEYSATLKAVFLIGSKLIAISVGDGLLFIRSNNTVHTFENTDGNFINETACLSYGMQIDTFKTIEIENTEKPFIFICTDGISSVISEGREQELFEEIERIKTIKELRREIEYMLDKMSEFNSDDKTAGVVRYE